VAETGTLTIVTNEGNGRMVTTLPPVHIAMMGMERLVPTLDDLALMLSLLPRSATGQKLSVYTQLIHRPEAGQQRHLILVDNGRSNLLNSPLEESLYCIRCGACLNACPVFREIGGHAYLGTNGDIAPYPGPIGSVVSPGLLGKDYFQLAQASTLCGACKDACPVDIDLPKLLTRVRAGKSAEQGNALSEPVKFGLRTYTRLATRPGLFAISQRLAGLGARFVAPVSGWLKFPAFTGWGYSKDFPRPAARPFRDRWKEVNHKEPSTSFKANSENPEPLRQEAEKATDLHASAVQKDNILQFTQELTALGGYVVEVTALDLPAQLLALLQEKGIDRVQVWESVPGLEEAALTEAGISVQHEADEKIKAGITGTLAGIVETGTIVIPGGEGQPLTASLLPEVHIAILRAADILPSVEAALSLPKVAESPGVVLVSGPSRTADIEMTLTIGVHGPGELHVFVIG
jgi:L-lactate dehydrogenase complex protein LldF